MLAIIKACKDKATAFNGHSLVTVLNLINIPNKTRKVVVVQPIHPHLYDLSTYIV